MNRSIKTALVAFSFLTIFPAKSFAVEVGIRRFSNTVMFQACVSSQQLVPVIAARAKRVSMNAQTGRELTRQEKLSLAKPVEALFVLDGKQDTAKPFISAASFSPYAADSVELEVCFNSTAGSFRVGTVTVSFAGKENPSVSAQLFLSKVLSSSLQVISFETIIGTTQSTAPDFFEEHADLVGYKRYVPGLWGTSRKVRGVRADFENAKLVVGNSSDAYYDVDDIIFGEKNY